MDRVDELYGMEYQRCSVEPPIVEAFDAIASALVEYFNPRTVCDVGAGGGALLRGLMARSIECVGLEGAEAAQAYRGPCRIIHHDLRLPFNKDDLPLPWGGGDLVTCTDVGEHIDREYHAVFCDTLVKCMAPGGALVFGAAGEGQDGLGHVACEHPCYWIDIFECRGLKLDAAGSEKLRHLVKSNEKHAGVWWWAKNAMLFRRKR